jgi:superkiller protein 3
MRIRALLVLLCLASPTFSAESWKARYESGLQLLDQGKYAEAQENFKAGIAENPGSSEIHNALGLVALQTGEPRSAVTSFERALELRPQDGKILYNLISAYLASNQPVPALQKTDQLLAGKTADPALYVQTGEVLSRFGHVAHALQCYRAAEGNSDKTAEA